MKAKDYKKKLDYLTHTGVPLLQATTVILSDFADELALRVSQIKNKQNDYDATRQYKAIKKDLSAKWRELHKLDKRLHKEAFSNAIATVEAKAMDKRTLKA